MASDNFTLDSSDISNLKTTFDDISSRLNKNYYHHIDSDIGIVAGGNTPRGLNVVATRTTVTMKTAAFVSSEITLPFKGSKVNPIVTATIVSSGKTDLNKYGLVCSVSITNGHTIKVYVDALNSTNAKKITASKPLVFYVHILAVAPV
jgi:hypothetical protein